MSIAKQEVPPPLTNQLKSENEDKSENIINKNKTSDRRLSDILILNNIYNNEKTEVSFDEKEGVEPRVLNSLLDNLMSDRTRSEQLFFRVRRIVKLAYATLDLEQKRIIRNALENMILGIARGELKVENKNIVLNLNVNINQQNNISRNENIVKLKRELDRAHREIERLLSENLDLKKRLEEVESKQKHDKDTQRKISELQRDLENYKYYLSVVYACLEHGCDLSDLREYIRNKIIDYFEKNKEKVLSVLKHLTRRSMVMPGGLP